MYKLSIKESVKESGGLNVLRPFEHATVNVGIYIAGPINRTKGAKTFRDDFMYQANEFIMKEDKYKVLANNRNVYFINCERDVSTKLLGEWKKAYPGMNFSQQDWEQQYMPKAKVMAFYFCGFYTKEDSHGFDMRNIGPTTRMEWGIEFSKWKGKMIIGMPETGCSNDWLKRYLRYHSNIQEKKIYVLPKENYIGKTSHESCLFPRKMTKAILDQAVEALNDVEMDIDEIY